MAGPWIWGPIYALDPPIGGLALARLREREAMSASVCQGEVRRSRDRETHEAELRPVTGRASIEYEDLNDVMLIGWSYGGSISTGVAERASERLAQFLPAMPRSPGSLTSQRFDPIARSEEGLTLLSPVEAAF